MAAAVVFAAVVVAGTVAPVGAGAAGTLAPPAETRYGVVAVIPDALPRDDRVGGIADNPITKTVYVSSYERSMVSVISGRTDTVTATLGVRYPGLLAVNTRTDVVYVGDPGVGDHMVSRIDGRTNRELAPVKVNGNPVGFAVNHLTNTVYVATRGDDPFESDQFGVTVINGRSDTVTRTLHVDGYPVSVAVDQVTDAVYVLTARNTLKIFDARTGQPSATVDLDGAFLGDAQAVAVDQTTHTAYVTETSVMYPLNRHHGAVAVVGANHQIAGAVPVDGRPHGIAVNSQTHTVFVADIGGNVSVIDGSTRRVTQVLRNRELNPRGDLAYDATADRLYVTDSQRPDVTVLGPVPCGTGCHASGG